ncbi:conserved hypothetical protein [Alteracholeplasma palmae J233]|uniref:Nucleotide kinase n=1 Tax=Alteracholeplasma palmae (strain ATCC 49389 / J233) TaxID=1318466 RepID=U4KJX3_ALTPJ|nr:AAA family ATPase [Alteracholeplasma palmae]CCV63772.1 conserved hypothetical protein [Alteracholeplasma palmae J233]
MKKIYMIGGTMGVGKTTISTALNKKLNNSVFLDGDWCWHSSPFQVNDETKQMVLDNIVYILNNFIKTTSYENIIFCWVMDKQEIIDHISGRLEASNHKLVKISLICSEIELKERLNSDIEKGLREPNIIKRSVERLGLFKTLKTIKIDTTSKSISNIVKEIESIQ